MVGSTGRPGVASRAVSKERGRVFVTLWCAAASTCVERGIGGSEGGALAVLEDLEVIAERERVFRIHVHTQLLREALAGVGAKGGWRCVVSGGSDVCCVTDAPMASPVGQVAPRQVLVVDPTPAAAAEAAHALGAGIVSGVFLSSCPSDLVTSLSMVTQGWVVTPAPVMELAATMPELSERQTAIVRAVIAGQRNSEIGNGLCLSTASIKREMALLFGALAVADRFELSRFGADLGLQPAPARL